MQPKTKPSRFGQAGAAIALRVVLVCCIGIPVASDSAGKSWKKLTHVDPATDTADPKTANVVCDQLTKNVDHRIQVIKGLKRDIAHSADAPPTSVLGALEGMMDNHRSDANVAEKQQKLASERKLADDLNSMLRASQCPTVDIDQALAHETVETTGPVLPDTPNILPQPATAPKR